jgi:hypothetical protein
MSARRTDRTSIRLSQQSSRRRRRSCKSQCLATSTAAAAATNYQIQNSMSNREMRTARLHVRSGEVTVERREKMMSDLEIIFRN